MCYDILDLLDTMPRQLAEDARDAIEKVEFKWDDYHKNQLAKAEADALAASKAFDDGLDDDDWDDEDDDGVEVITFAIEHHVRDKTGARQAPVFMGGSTGSPYGYIFMSLIA